MKPPPPGLAAVSSVVAALAYSSFLLSRWTDGKPATGGFVSELEDPGQPWAWFYRGSDVMAGLAVLIAAWTLFGLVAGHRWSRVGVGLLAVVGLASMLDGVTSMRCDPSTDLACARGEQSVSGLVGQLTAVHTDTGLLGFVAGAAGAVVLGAAMADRWTTWGRLQIVVGVAIAGCGLADIVLLLGGQDVGAAERTRVLFTSLWFLLIGGYLFAAARKPPSGSGRSDEPVQDRRPSSAPRTRR